MATLATALVCAFPQDESPEATIEEELVALIEKTNAMETFHAVYEIENTAEGLPAQTSAEVVYQAPGTGRVLVSSDQGEQDMWVVGDRMYHAIADAWRSAELPAPSDATRAVDELLPRSGALEPGVWLQLQVTRNGDSPLLNLNMSTAFFDRAAVLQWLLEMQRDLSHVTVEGELLAWNNDGGRVLVSRTTGFIEVIDLATEKGEAHVRLRSLQIDETLDDSLVKLPAEAREGSPNLDFNRQLTALLPDLARTEALGRALDMVEAGQEEDARRAWRSFLEVMHHEKMGRRYPPWIENVRGEVAKKVSTMRDKRASDDSPESLGKLRELVATARAGLEQVLDTEQNTYLELLRSSEKRSYEELSDIEREIVRELYDEDVRQPILSHYDEEMRAVIDE